MGRPLARTSTCGLVLVLAVLQASPIGSLRLIKARPFRDARTDSPKCSSACSLSSQRQEGRVIPLIQEHGGLPDPSAVGPRQRSGGFFLCRYGRDNGRVRPSTTDGSRLVSTE